MHRIEGANFKIIAGKNTFTDGPPGTAIGADWLNAVQEEIATVIESEGIALSTASVDTHGQLLEAINLKTTISKKFTSIETFIVFSNLVSTRIVALTAGTQNLASGHIQAVVDGDITKKIELKSGQTRTVEVTDNLDISSIGGTPNSTILTSFASPGGLPSGRANVIVISDVVAEVNHLVPYKRQVSPSRRATVSV